MVGHLSNRTLAVSAARGEEVLVVFLTVRLAVSLKETTCAQFLAACCAHKVFWMPHLTQSCDHLQFGIQDDMFVSTEN